MDRKSSVVGVVGEAADWLAGGAQQGNQRLVEAGRVETHPEQTVLTALADDLGSVFAPWPRKKLDFSIDIADDVPHELFNDRQRLRQILANLLSNAIKFTPAGRVNLSVQVTARNDQDRLDEEPEIAFVVTDTGAGLSAGNLDFISGAFQQGDGTTSREYGGSGLGLAICREAAVQLGGEDQCRQ